MWKVFGVGMIQHVEFLDWPTKKAAAELSGILTQ